MPAMPEADRSALLSRQPIDTGVVAIAPYLTDRRVLVTGAGGSIGPSSVVRLFDSSQPLKTNIWGTLSVLQAASAANVERLVNISTDKAANPACVLE